MAIIPQNPLFDWQTAEACSDLQRLPLVLESLPDEGLMQALGRRRGRRGRNDYPIRAMWNAVVAGVVFQHESAESLRRELLRNGELRQACGFNPFRGAGAVPTPDAFSRFLKSLLAESERIGQMFDSLVETLRGLLPDLGQKLAVDGKALPTHARGRKNPADSSDPEANWGKKTKKGRREDGSCWEKVTKWFGYKLHLLVDSRYELPLAFELTRASADETTRLPGLVKGLAKRHPELVEGAEEAAADKGYDSAKNNALLWDRFGIKPLIDIRSMWKGEEQTKLLDPARADNVVYDESGQLYCHCPHTGEQREMAFQGFEKDRNCLKYRCPAAAYGFDCQGRARCPGAASQFGRTVRVKLETDRRIFTPIARSSHAWVQAYKRRTAVERVNSRIDTSFGFERHYIRGKKKMHLRVTLALVVMLALAVGHIRDGEMEKIRSLVQPRAA